MVLRGVPYNALTEIVRDRIKKTTRLERIIFKGRLYAHFFVWASISKLQLLEHIDPGLILLVYDNMNLNNKKT